MLAQVAQELDHEGRGDRGVALLQLQQDLGDRRRCPSLLDHTGCPDIASAPVARGRLRCRERAYGEDQAQAQHDRNRPKLPDGERMNRLVREHVAGERGEIDAPVRVAEVVETKAVGSRIAAHAAVRKTRQLHEVASR